jgi:hypothetical protein
MHLGARLGDACRADKSDENVVGSGPKLTSVWMRFQESLRRFRGAVSFMSAWIAYMAILYWKVPRVYFEGLQNNVSGGP